MSSTTGGAVASSVTVWRLRGLVIRHTCEPPVSLVRKLAASSEPSGHTHSAAQAARGCTAGSPSAANETPPFT